MTTGVKRMACIFALVVACAACGCDAADGRGASADADSDSDSDTDSDTDSDSDSDTDSDSDADSDSDTDEDCIDTDYPSGPYGWYLDEVVGEVSFPGILADAETALAMNEAHCTEIKALVFALGAND